MKNTLQRLGLRVVIASAALVAGVTQAQIPYQYSVHGSDVSLTLGLGNGPSQDGRSSWRSEGFNIIGEAGNVIARINRLDVAYDTDPAVTVSFVATAAAVDTTFTISSAVVTFPPIGNPIGTAAADIMLIDSSQNGASLSPISPDIGMFRALYNGSGSTFAQLLGPQTLSSGGTLSASENAGPAIIANPVSDIQARFHFTLSANDSATGTGTFRVEQAVSPAPDAGATLLLAFLALLPLGVARIKQLRPNR